MIIYLSGPMTGIERYNRDAFLCVARELEALGHVVLNPGRQPDGLTRSQYMRLAYADIDVCDIIIMLPGWEKSAGACAERNYAATHRLMPVAYYPDHEAFIKWYAGQKGA